MYNVHYIIIYIDTHYEYLYSEYMYTNVYLLYYKMLGLYQNKLQFIFHIF